MAGKSKAHGLEGALDCIRENLSGDPHVGIRDVSECELAGLKREMVRLSVSPAPSMPATQTPPAPSARTSPRKLAGACTPLAAPACRRARIDDRASGAGSVRRRACRVACLAWAMRWRARCSTRRSRCGSPYELSSFPHARSPSPPFSSSMTRSTTCLSTW